MWTCYDCIEGRERTQAEPCDLKAQSCAQSPVTYTDQSLWPMLMSVVWKYNISQGDTSIPIVLGEDMLIILSQEWQKVIGNDNNNETYLFFCHKVPSLLDIKWAHLCLK